MLPPVEPVQPRALAAVPTPVAPVDLQLSADQAEQQLEHEWQERDYRRAQRTRHRHGIRRTRQCPSCRLFTVRAHCPHCDFIDTGTAA